MMMKSGIFVSGTDTGIGKTFVSSLLLSAIKKTGSSVGYFKPVQTGSDLDSVTVSYLTGLQSPEVAEPCYSFPQPVAPYRAAVMENTQIQLDAISTHWNQLRFLNDQRWVVEGAGGLLVPLNSRQTIRDLVLILNLGLLVVASTRLGTLNHTLLTLESAQSAGISVKGVVLVGPEDVGLEEVLSRFTDVPILTRIPFFDSVSPQLIAQEGPRCFTPELLNKIYE